MQSLKLHIVPHLRGDICIGSGSCCSQAALRNVDSSGWSSGVYQKLEHSGTFFTDNRVCRVAENKAPKENAKALHRCRIGILFLGTN